MKTQLPLNRLLLAATLAVAAAFQPVAQAAESGDLFSKFFEAPGDLPDRPVGYIFSPDSYYDHMRAAELNAEAAAGRKVGIYVRATDSDPRVTTPLTTILSQITKLDYALGDLEPLSDVDTTWYLNTVRAASNPNVNSAFVGTYNYYPGPTDNSVTSPTGRDRMDRHEAYLDIGIDAAMPSLYPATSDIKHTDASLQGSNVAPNPRSAYFWASLEKLSGVALYLPAGHKLIPFIMDINDQNKNNTIYPVPTVPTDQWPTVADNKASVHHYRLRGASGYYIWSYKNARNPRPQRVADSYHVTWEMYEDGRDYENQMRTAWNALDADSAGPEVKSLLNLTTDKLGGLQWSGVRNGNAIKILLSNLGNAARTATYPAGWGLPAQSASIPVGTHTFASYTIANLATNSDFTSNASGWSLSSPGSSWSSTGGHNTPGCIQLNGAVQAFTSNQPLNTESNARMNFSVWAKRTSTAGALRVVAQGLNAAGTVVWTSNNIINSALSTGWVQYSANFTVGSTAGIKSLKLIFNNNAAPDTLLIDEPVLKFTSSTPTAPAAPSNLTATAAGANQINLAWDDNSENENQFRIERKAGAGSFGFLVNQPADSIGYNDTGLTASTSYTYQVRAENSTGNSAFSNSASATTGSGNTAPTIGNIADQTIAVNGNTGALGFTIGDAETPAGSLTLSKASSNPTLAPPASIVFGGSGANRTVTVTPAAGQTGTATITVTVSDGSLTAQDTFLLTVTSGGSTTLLNDNFARADGAAVGNGWTETESATATGAKVSLLGGKLWFEDTSEKVNQPMAQHSFTTTSSGLVTWSFDFNWARSGNESVYRLFMQLGDSTMTPSSQSTGVGVNLVWTLIGTTHESLGWRDGSTNTSLATVTGAHNITVTADVTAHTYSVKVDGVVKGSNIPFDNIVNLSQVRFFTDALDEVNHTGRTFDNVVITTP